MSAPSNAAATPLMFRKLLGNIRSVRRNRRNGGCRVDCEHGRTDDDRLPWRTSEYGGWGGHEYHGTEPGADRTPVVFVHGLGRDACDWQPHAEFFADWTYTGDELWAITFGSSIPTHETMADQLEAFVSRVREHAGVETVSVVGHSLGVIGLRYWLHREDRYDWVEDFVGLAGPNHGTKLLSMAARHGIDSGAYRMSPVLRSDYERFGEHPLKELNREETPGDVEYYTVRGSEDPLFMACPGSPALEGAENALLETDHDGVRADLESIELVYEWVSGETPYDLGLLAESR
jgi:pimeloyl-ACP methyl ester carboxylesterase